MVKKTRMGKINVPLDVRNENDVPAFEKILENGPMMVVLVYADWCGHCTKYKENVWSPLKSIKNRTMNMASVHYDQLENTSLKNSKIDGYPSLLVVGKDKVPATFKSPSGTTTNAMPKSNDFTTMKNLVTSPVVEKNDEEKVLVNSINTLPKISSSLKPSTLETENTVDEMNVEEPNVEASNAQGSNMEASTLENENTNTESLVSPALSQAAAETVPKISEDVVTLTNSMGKTNTVAPPPSTPVTPGAVTMMGGRLYRMLSLKKKRRGGSKKRKNTRKTAKF